MTPTAWPRNRCVNSGHRKSHAHDTSEQGWYYLEHGALVMSHTQDRLADSKPTSPGHCIAKILHDGGCYQPVQEDNNDAHKHHYHK
eukprot:2340334-Rhodomonas_salina.2